MFLKPENNSDKLSEEQVGILEKSGINQAYVFMVVPKADFGTPTRAFPRLGCPNVRFSTIETQVAELISEKTAPLQQEIESLKNDLHGKAIIEELKTHIAELITEKTAPLQQGIESLKNGLRGKATIQELKTQISEEIETSQKLLEQSQKDSQEKLKKELAEAVVHSTSPMFNRICGDRLKLKINTDAQ